MPTRRIIEASFITTLATISLLGFLRLEGQKVLAEHNQPGWKTFLAKTVVW